jgi:hypothetical protein
MVRKFSNKFIEFVINRIEEDPELANEIYLDVYYNEGYRLIYPVLSMESEKKFHALSEKHEIHDHSYFCEMGDEHIDTRLLKEIYEIINFYDIPKDATGKCDYFSAIGNFYKNVRKKLIQRENEK